MATNVLDTLVGDILPHVRIKKIIVEEDPSSTGTKYNQLGSGDLKVTLQMELYQRKDSVLTKSWLADIDLNLNDTEMTSIFDCFNLNIITLQSNRGLSYLRKAQPTTKINDVYSIFMKEQLAWEQQGGYDVPARNLDYWDLVGGGNYKSGANLVASQKAQGDPFANIHKSKLHLSGLVGMTSTGFTGNPGIDIANGPVREEVYKGDVYYAIPYEHSFSWKAKLTPEELIDRLQVAPPDANPFEKGLIDIINKKWVQLVDEDENGNYFAPNLGIITYASLNLADVLDIPAGAYKFKDSLDMEGPPSAEIVIKGGKVASTREAFVDNDGREWSGPVHYHGTSTADGQIEASPAPDGYIGYMAGTRHQLAAQSKLNVIKVPNSLVHDMVDPINQKIPDEMFVTKPDGTVVMTGVDASSNVKPMYQDIEDELALIGGTLGVKYQKGTIKDIYKDKKDNDNEYSRLYVSRNKSNSAHGMFYIDFKNLILNNSYYLKFLNSQSVKNPYYLNEILKKSYIIDLKINRKRINPASYRNGYKCFADGTAYEEAPRLLGTIADEKSFKTQKTTYQTEGATLNEVSLVTSTAAHTRYFAFSDSEVSNFSAGEYQYETELKFYDGTALFIKDRLMVYKQVRKQLDAYYSLASSSVRKDALSEASISKTNGQIGDEKHTKKSLYTPYYDNNYKSFRPEFSALAYEDKSNPVSEFHNQAGIPVWVQAPQHIFEYLKIFSPIGDYADLGPMASKYTKLLYPGPAVSGSPEGIMLIIKLYDNMISQLEKILGSAKTKKANNSNFLQGKTATGDSQALPDSFYENKMCSTEAIIYESHSFDHPNEVFRATANKNYYVDFLSLGTELYSSYGGIRTISRAYLTQRCLAELSKYTTYALADPLLLTGQASGKQDGGSIAPLQSAGSGLSAYTRIKNKDGSLDNLSNQMFSYLTPSSLELSDSSKGESSFQFRYRAFSTEIQNVIAGSAAADINTIYGADYFNSNYMNSVLVSLANFVKNKNDLGYADISDSYAKGSDLTSPDSYNNSKVPVNQREAYKSYFSKHNITIHDQGKHNIFFGAGSTREPGADITKQTPPDFDSGVTSDYYSDGMTVPNDFFDDFIVSKTQTKLEVPAGTTTYNGNNWNENLPNAYKFFRVYNSFKQFGVNENFMRPLMRDMFDTSWEGNNALKFFNFNMVAAIEKLSGHGVNTNDASGQTSKIALDDKWELLKESDLTSGERIFCRIRYWDARLIGDVEQFPVLDKYFILTDNPQEETYVPIMVPIVSTVLGDNVSAVLAYFESQNQSMLQDFATLLGKGMTNLGVLDLPQTGPDPSPISMPVGGMAAAGGSAQQAMGGAMQQAGMQQTGMNQPSPGMSQMQGGSPGGGSSGGGSGGGGGY